MGRAGGLLSSVGSRMGLGRFSGFFRSAGGLAGRLGGGALWAGAMAAPVLLDGSASATDKGEAVGSLAGSIAVVRWGGSRTCGDCHWFYGGQLSR
ncbi:tape measure protein [Escherichia coli]|nr:tape measure protein [Escherichia coli]